MYLSKHILSVSIYHSPVTEKIKYNRKIVIKSVILGFSYCSICTKGSDSKNLQPLFEHKQRALLNQRNQGHSEIQQGYK